MIVMVSSNPSERLDGMAGLICLRYRSSLWSFEMSGAVVRFRPSFMHITLDLLGMLLTNMSHHIVSLLRLEALDDGLASRDM
jgi:hypothetical protein